MSEVKNIIISIIIFICWSAGCFIAGYILSNRNATERINKANNELAEQQQKYELVIATTTARLQDIRGQLFTEVSNNGKTTTELSGIVEQIRRQKLNIQI